MFLLKALEKAKESHRKERQIVKEREEKGLTEQTNIELHSFVNILFF